MKTACLTIIIVVGACFAVSAETIDTVVFSIDLLNIDPVERTVGYGDLESIADDDRPSVPVAGLLYHGRASSDAFRVYGLVVSADTLELGFGPRLNNPDRITSDIDLSIPRQNILRKTADIYPAEALTTASAKIQANDIWSISIYPVQFLGDDRIIFNRQIIICTDDDQSDLEPGRGMSMDSYPSMQSPDYSLAFKPSTDNGCPLGGDLVIVTSPTLTESFDGLLDLKRRTGFNAAVAVTDSIYLYYGGIDAAEKMRNYLKNFYEAGGRWVILGGDENHVPIRYAYYYNADEAPDLYHSMICDQYFADFDGDWDFDGDGIWGEPTQDHPDMGPEVAVGRLPFGSAEQVTKYTAKLKNYLFNPGNGDPAYLDRAAFFTSDQMRDYFENGQQYAVAESYPGHFALDCEGLAESPTGIDPSPTGPSAERVFAELGDGYGMVNVLAHGRPDGFVLNSSEYNQYPKTYMLTGTGHVSNAAFEDLPRNLKTAFYYTISCEQGAIDLESLYGMVVPSLVEELLALDSAGAVGVVAFSRWGWVASSYKLMASFYQHLFDDARGLPVEAMYGSWLDYPYYRDQIYGQNYYGDPSVQIYRGLPGQAAVEGAAAYYPSQPIHARLTFDDVPLADYPLTVRIGSDSYQTVISDVDGYVEINPPETCTEDICLTLSIPGHVSADKILRPAFLADADDDHPPVPFRFELHQNYPNPFNPATTISYIVPESGPVVLAVYNILGRVVDVLIDELSMAGEYTVVWNGTDHSGNDVASGIYFYRLVCADRTETRKMALIR